MVIRSGGRRRGVSRARTVGVKFEKPVFLLLVGHDVARMHVSSEVVREGDLDRSEPTSRCGPIPCRKCP